MIYITGDTHADFSRFSKKRMKNKGMELTEQDYMLVCGDFGLCWARDGSFDYNCKLFEDKPYTILWVQENHENYDMIEEFPIEEWKGGKARHIIRDKVILLERGQVFNIDGKTFFTFGGASSHDIQGGVLERNDINFAEKRRRAIRDDLPYRILHESWWTQELPSEEEMAEGIANLEKVNYQVDYVITHCCSSGTQEILDETPGRLYKTDVLTDYFQKIEEKLQYKQWYFGHYHINRNVDSKHTVLYREIIPLGVEIDENEVPVLRRPRYRIANTVEFLWKDTKKVGKICIVDPYGTFGQMEEPSYDILVREDNCLYKHVCEREVIRKVL